MIVEHIGITVSDLEKSIDFYTKVFGFSLLRKTPINAYLYLDNELLELMQSEAPTRKGKNPTSEDLKKLMFGVVGLNHIGFRVDDLDKAVERIKKRGGKLIMQPMKFEPKIEFKAEPAEDKLRRVAKPMKKPYWRVATFSDPDGIMLELIER